MFAFPGMTKYGFGPKQRAWELSLSMLTSQADGGPLFSTPLLSSTMAYKSGSASLLGALFRMFFFHHNHYDLLRLVFLATNP